MRIPHLARSEPHPHPLRSSSRQGNPLSPFPLAVLISFTAAGVGVALAALAVPAPLIAQVSTSVQTRIDLEVRMTQEFMPDVPDFDGGRWTASYRISGPWTLARDASGAETVIRALGGILGGNRPSMSEVTGSAYEVCMDGNADRWRTDYEPSVRIEPGTLTASGEGDQVHLWYSIPIVEMFHPGHDHIPVRSECHTMDPGMTELWLFTADLEDAGARTNEYGELLVATLPWEDLVAVGEGGSEPIRVEAVMEGLGITFEVRGTIGPPGGGG